MKTSNPPWLNIGSAGWLNIQSARTAEGLRLAAIASVRYKLAMADAIIWQTAQAHGARLYTQDADLKDAPGVQYRAKRV